MSAERPLILVIEDNREDWEIYGKILWYNGFDVLYAAEGREGLRLCRQHRPDLVLLDNGLPDMSGLDLCLQLQQHADTRGTPVLMLSARPGLEYGPRAVDAGCLEYLEKPISPLEVLRHVERVAGRPPKPGEGRPPILRTA